MDDGYDIKADMVIAMQTLDITSFKDLLFSSAIPITEIIDTDCVSLFHELGLSSLPESCETKFLEIIISYFYKKYEEEATDKIKQLLNQATKNDKLTPLMVATKGCKLVIPI